MTDSNANAEPRVSFNLWHEPWIRIASADGKLVEVSIYDCLTYAHELGALADPTPLVVAGTQRLLAAILQFIYAPKFLDDLSRLLKAKRFDATKLEAFAAEYAHRFDLFDPTEPFLQTGDVSLAGLDAENESVERSPVSRLFIEIPGATNRTLFHHVTDESHVVCPACCATGLIVIPPFASSGGPGIRPSINGVPPIYTLPIGDTLFETLAMSLVTTAATPKSADPGRAREAIWNSPNIVLRGQQLAAVGYVESLVFPARRLRLFPLVTAADETIRCTQCGRTTIMYVKDVFYEMGHWLDSKAVGPWDDPFVAFQARNPKKPDEYPKSIQTREGKALWREFNGLFLAANEQGERPKIISQMHKLIDYNAISVEQPLRTRCIWLRTDGKAKTFEWGDEALESPSILLNVEHSSVEIAAALGHAEEVKGILRKWFAVFSKLHDKGGDKNAFTAIRERMEADYWQALSDPFRAFIRDLAAAYVTTDDSAVSLKLASNWDETLFSVGIKVSAEAFDQLGSNADAIRARVLAEARLSTDFNKKRIEWRPQ